jgi:cell division protein FtsX
MEMDESNEEPRQDTGNRDALLGAVALGVLLGLMAWWYYYPYPSGKHPSLVDFLMFWGREAVLVVLLVGALAFGALAFLTALVVRSFIAAWRWATQAFSTAPKP